MKTLVLGGIKSGKSRIAEEFILGLETPPIYLATTEFIDAELTERIKIHKEQRGSLFITIEEPLYLQLAISKYSSPVLIECLSMWINNMMHHGKNDVEILKELQNLLKLPNDLVFVLNEVGTGIIPDNALARRFVDLTGKISQILASHCENVFYCIAGIPQTLKGKL